MLGFKELETLAKLRKSEVIAYFTSDKNSGNPAKPDLFLAQIADDAIPLFSKQLKTIGKVPKISLFLYSAGGFLTTPWPIANLLREYCDELEVIVPFRALSAATLLALSADKIVMTPLSQLGPIDPTGNFILGDKNLQVQVEDITSFISFAKEKVKLNSQQSLSDVLQEITKHIPPQVVGSINRTHSLIRMLAEKMLKLHSKPIPPKLAAKITSQLTETLFSHQHYINRTEAKESIGFGNLIEFANPKNEDAINNLFDVYTESSTVLEPFDPIAILGDNTEHDMEVLRAAVHSSKLQFSLVGKYKLQKVTNPTGGHALNVAHVSSRWVELKK